MGDPLVTCGVLMRIAGGAIEGMSLDAFITQATEYAEEDDLFARWSRAWVEIGMTHPFAVRRVRELVQWVSSGDYDRIRSGDYVKRGEEPPPSAHFEAAAQHYRERFSQMLERAAGGAQSWSVSSMTGSEVEAARVRLRKVTATTNGTRGTSEPAHRSGFLECQVDRVVDRHRATLLPRIRMVDYHSSCLCHERVVHAPEEIP